MRVILVALATALITAAAAAAQVPPQFHALTLTLKNHRFTPETADVPAGVRVRINLVNKDAATEEFDSDDLHVEKNVSPNGKISFVVGPLKPGTYRFIGELHADTASGTINAVAAP